MAIFLYLPSYLEVELSFVTTSCGSGYGYMFEEYAYHQSLAFVQ
jgi:hypothetical protein